MAKRKTLATGTWIERMAAATAEVDRPGDFCTSGAAADTVPGLDVTGLGPIGLPLSVDEAARLKRQCEQAAYGKGTRTVVDTNVRRVWRLPADRFTLANPAWQASVDGMVAAVQKDLGLESQELQPHLYDLLLYEPGGFFLPHRDGEKLDRMVATLVVMLPTHYTGGELLVRHEGEEQVIDLGGEPSRFKTQYAAFYADCEHEVKPVKSGHRLCLVYNLTLAKSNRRVGAPQRDEHVRRATALLQAWPATDDDPHKLAVTLEHQYTRDGLTWDALKGVDRTRADVLVRAAAAAGCRAYLALLTKHELGASDGGDDDWYGRRGRWGRSGSGSGGGGAGRKHVMGEIYESSLSADGWLAPDGAKMPFGELPVEESEICPKGSLLTAKPEEDYEGYTGNAGMTLERWYRRAVVAVWPEANHFDVLVDAGAIQAVPALLQLADAGRSATGAEADALRDQCRRFAAAVLQAWPAPLPNHWATDCAPVADPLPALDFVDDVPLIHTYLRQTLLADPGVNPGASLAPILSRHGWPTFAADLVAVFDGTDRLSLGRNVRLLDRLSRAATAMKAKPRRSEAVALCRSLAAVTVAAVATVDADPDARYRFNPVESAARLATLAQALLRLDDDVSLSALVAHASSAPDRYPLQAVHMAALGQLAPWVSTHPDLRSPALARWVAGCRRQLEVLTAAVPQPPADERRQAAVVCTCADCAALNSFLADPAEHQHRFQMAHDRRNHLDQQIRHFRCDVVTTTDKAPRPQVLVGTKNTATYERLLKEYHENVAHLATLSKIDVAGSTAVTAEPTGSPATGLAGRKKPKR